MPVLARAVRAGARGRPPLTSPALPRSLSRVSAHPATRAPTVLHASAFSLLSRDAPPPTGLVPQVVSMALLLLVLPKPALVRRTHLPTRWPSGGQTGEVRCAHWHPILSPRPDVPLCWQMSPRTSASAAVGSRHRGLEVRRCAGSISAGTRRRVARSFPTCRGYRSSSAAAVDLRRPHSPPPLPTPHLP